MAKSNKKKRGVSLTQSKYLRTGALALVGLVVAGGAFAATSGDLAYGGRSLLAQVSGYVDTTPRLTIVRSAYTPSGSIWAGAGKTLAIFDVKPKYLSSYGYLRSFSGGVYTDSKTAGLNVGTIGVEYVVCDLSNGACSMTKVGHNVTASSTAKGLLYSFSTNTTERLPAVGPNASGKIIITGHPYYGSIYNNPAAPLPAASVKAQIDVASGSGQVCTSSGYLGNCVYNSVPVYTTLAYGNWLKVARPTGYAYGYWDINNNGSLTASDADMVLKAAVQTITCPFTKKCDIDQSGRVTATDANLLLKYAVGSLPPPGTVPAKASPAINFVGTAAAATTGDSANDDRGTFKITYTVMAIGGDIYVPSTVKLQSSTAGLPGKTSVRVERNGALVTTGTTVDLSTATISGMTGVPVSVSTGNHLIRAGDSVTYTAYVTVQLPAAGAAGSYRVLLSGIGWGTTDVTNLPNTIVTGLDTFKTNYLNLN